MNFVKPALLPEQHINLLQNRGLMIDDREKALQVISTVGYFRLSGYMHPLQEVDDRHIFKKDVSFDKILSFYNFDQKLRSLIWETIETIEVALRTSISDTYSLKYGPHWYLDSRLFKKAYKHSVFLARTKDFLKNSDFKFIKRYQEKYKNPMEPPAWMLMETLTFGQLSLLFENLKGSEEKKLIASKFNTIPPILESWLLSLSSLRNFCAHHSRIWNRKFAIKPKLPERSDLRILTSIHHDTNWRLYGILSCLLHMLITINPKTNFKKKLKLLFEEYNQIQKSLMGFQKGWENEKLWN